MSALIALYNEARCSRVCQCCVCHLFDMKMQLIVTIHQTLVERVLMKLFLPSWGHEKMTIVCLLLSRRRHRMTIGLKVMEFNNVLTHSFKIAGVEGTTSTGLSCQTIYLNGALGYILPYYAKFRSGTVATSKLKHRGRCCLVLQEDVEVD